MPAPFLKLNYALIHELWPICMESVLIIREFMTIYKLQEDSVINIWTIIANTAKIIVACLYE